MNPHSSPKGTQLDAEGRRRAKSRRRLLTLSAVAALALVQLSACSSDNSPSGSAGAGGNSPNEMGGSGGDSSSGTGGDAGQAGALGNAGAAGEAGQAGAGAAAGEAGSAGTAGEGGSAGAPRETPAQKVKQLEDSGAIPTLDRGPDVAGPDSDSNGVRDDIDTFVGKRGYTSQQLAAVQQLARGLQNALVLGSGTTPVSTTAARPVSIALGKAIHCVWSRFDAAPGPLSAHAITSTYQKLTANTEARVRAYLQYNHALTGTAYSLPRGASCEN